MKPGAIIGLRPSMVKFESQSCHLEVCTFAMPLVFYLNRQIILALRTLGIPDRVFVSIYRNIVNCLDAIRGGGKKGLEVRSLPPSSQFNRFSSLLAPGHSEIHRPASKTGGGCCHVGLVALYCDCSRVGLALAYMYAYWGVLAKNGMTY
jgi:hypothetical protein